MQLLSVNKSKQVLKRLVYKISRILSIFRESASYKIYLIKKNLGLVEG